MKEEILRGANSHNAYSKEHTRKKNKMLRFLEDSLNFKSFLIDKKPFVLNNSNEIVNHRSKIRQSVMSRNKFNFTPEAKSLTLSNRKESIIKKPTQSPHSTINSRISFHSSKSRLPLQSKPKIRRAI
jgi:hypothetical protein